MESAEFSLFRGKLEKTQKELAQLLGTSLKAIHSYEQAWRTIPPHVERQLFYLILKKRGLVANQKNCWAIKKCPPEKRKACPAWEFKSGDMCWFTCGTLCSNEVLDKWAEKMLICRSCEVLAPILEAVKNDSQFDPDIGIALPDVIMVSADIRNPCCELAKHPGGYSSRVR